MTAPDPITRLNEALVGRYRVERQLGEGGMATVYLADDLRHHRKVAVKILKEQLAAVIGAERFLAEIRMTANLQHPNILPLFDSGEADGSVFYVMPYVEGESLADRLDRESQLPVEDSVRIATEVADALAHAHRAGVVHRDIKPANILLRDGRPHVADFGIALAVSTGGGGRLTETGMSLGTPHYMSPEQASGDQSVDGRSDVYALGCVLYEMLGGEPPFTGRTAQSVLARILTEDPPPIGELRSAVPPNVADAVEVTLQKLPADRFQDAGALSAALQNPAYRRPRSWQVDGSTAAPSSRAKLHSALTLALAIAAVGMGIALSRGGNAPSPSPPIAFTAIEGGLIEAVDVADDGTVAWLSQQQIHVRPAGSVDATPIPGIDDVGRSFALDPDGGRLAYTDRDLNLWLVELPEGSRTQLWNADPRGALLGQIDWSDDDWIYGTGVIDGETSVVRFSPLGEVEIVWRLDAGSFAPLRVLPLPDGQGLFVVLISMGTGDMHTVHLDPARRDTVSVSDRAVVAGWLPPDNLILARQGDGTARAQQWDLAGRTPVGPEVPLSTSAGVGGWGPRFALSSTGTLVHMTGGTDRMLAQMDSVYHVYLWSGQDSIERLPVEPTAHPDAAISPDGRRVAYTRSGDIRVFDVDRGTDRAVTGDGSDPHDPVWSPGGDSIAYTTDEGRIEIRSADGSGPGRVLDLFPDSVAAYASQWLGEGTLLVRTDASGNIDLFSASVSGAGAPEVLLGTAFTESRPKVSPDGRWIAYVSAAGGGPGLFLRRWPDFSDPRRLSREDERVSADSEPIWSARSDRVTYTRNSPTFDELWILELDGGGRVVDRRVVLQAPDLRLRHSPQDDRILLLSRYADLPAWNQSESLRVVVNWSTPARERLREGRTGR